MLAAGPLLAVLLASCTRRSDSMPLRSRGSVYRTVYARQLDTCTNSVTVIQLVYHPKHEAPVTFTAHCARPTTTSTLTRSPTSRTQPMTAVLLIARMRSRSRANGSACHHKAAHSSCTHWVPKAPGAWAGAFGISQIGPSGARSARTGLGSQVGSVM